MILLIVYHKAWFPYARNCRKGVVSVVRVVFTTKWKHEEKSCRNTLATVHDSDNSVKQKRVVTVMFSWKQKNDSVATVLRQSGGGAKAPFGGPCLSF